MSQIPFLQRYTAVSILLPCLLHWLNVLLVFHYLHRIATIYISSNNFVLEGDNLLMIYCDGFYTWVTSRYCIMCTHFRNSQSNDGRAFFCPWPARHRRRMNTLSANGQRTIRLTRHCLSGLILVIIKWFSAFTLSRQSLGPLCCSLLSLRQFKR